MKTQNRKYFHPYWRKECGKIRWPTELEAKLALANCRTARNPKQREEQRYYWCGRCHGWHLTSKDQR